MSGICSKHRGHEPTCELCNAYAPPAEGEGERCEVRVYDRITGPPCGKPAILLINGLRMCREHVDQWEKEGLIEGAHMLPGAVQIDPTFAALSETEQVAELVKRFSSRPAQASGPVDLNAAVTAAIIEAERSPSVETWSRVKELEIRLSTEAETEAEIAIALRGIETAAEQVRALQDQPPREVGEPTDEWMRQVAHDAVIAYSKTPAAMHGIPASVTHRALYNAGRSSNAAAKETLEPTDMILFCLQCGMQHIDAPNLAKNWDNPPHRSHECQRCGYVWRPANVATNGVATITTKGSADREIVPHRIGVLYDLNTRLRNRMVTLRTELLTLRLQDRMKAYWPLVGAHYISGNTVVAEQLRDRVKNCSRRIEKIRRITGFYR